MTSHNHPERTLSEIHADLTADRPLDLYWFRRIASEYHFTDAEIDAYLAGHYYTPAKVGQR